MLYFGVLLIVLTWDIVRAAPYGVELVNETNEQNDINELSVPCVSVWRSLDWWKWLPRDTKYVISAPTRWDKVDWIKSSFIIGTTCGIMAQDETIQAEVQSLRTTTSERIATLIEPFGAEGAIIALASLYLTGAVIRDTTLKKVALLSAESALISGFIVSILKMSIGRSRPYKEEGAFRFSPFNIHSENHSMPSGHTGAAFGIASCISEECSNPFITIISYSTAGLVGLSRIHDNKHWASDVFFGAVLGVSVGKTIAKLH